MMKGKKKLKGYLRKIVKWIYNCFIDIDPSKISVNFLRAVLTFFSSIGLSVIFFKYMVESGLYFGVNGIFTTWMVIFILSIIPISILIIERKEYGVNRITFIITFILVIYTAVILFGSGFISSLGGFMDGIKERKVLSSKLEDIQTELSGLKEDISKINNTCK